MLGKVEAADPAKPATPVPGAQPVAAVKKVDFEKQILPILKRNCLACHNATDAEGDLVLETPATILKGGESGPAVIPKKSLESYLIQTAAHQEKPFMPPKNNKVGAEMLKDDELALLKTWIDQGATGTVTSKVQPVKWRPLPPGLHPILAISLTTDGQFVACGRANQIFVYHLPTGQVVARLTDPKLAEQTGRSGYKTSAQRDFVQSLAFSPDGRLLASGEYRMVKLWQREPNLPQFTLGKDPVSAIAASPDGKWLATAAKDNVIRVWEAATGKAVKEFPGHTATVTSLRFSPDNTRLLSGSEDKSVRIWEVAAGKVVTQVEAAAPVSAVAWVLGGKQIASAGGDNVVRLWQLPTQPDGPLTPGKELTGHTQPVTCLEAFPDGKQLLSGSADGSVRQWMVEAAKQVRQLDHGAPVVAVAVSPNGKTLASAGGTSARLWSADKGQPLGEMKGDHQARQKIGRAERALAFSKTETAYWKTTSETAAKNLTARHEGLKKATDAVTPAVKTVEEKRATLEKAADDKAKAEAADALKKAESGKATAEVAQKAAEQLDKQAGQAVAEAKAGTDKAAAALQKAEADLAQEKKAATESEKPIRAVAFSSNNLTVATAGEDQMIRTWSADNGNGFDVYPGQIGPVQSLGYLADGRLFSAAAQNGAVVWRTVPSWTLARSIGTGDEKSPLINRVIALEFSPNGQWLATGGGAPSRSGEVKLWKVSDGSLVREITPSHSDTVYGLDFSPDGKLLATASADKFVKIFDASNGQLVKPLSGHTHYVLGVNWRADGRSLASSGADQAVKLWSFPSGEQLKNVPGFNKEVTSIRFVGFGGEMLATSGDTKVRLLKEDGTAARDFAGGKGFIFSAAITPDGQTVVGGGQDSILRVWDATTGKSIFTLDAPTPETAVKTNPPAK